MKMTQRFTSLLKQIALSYFILVLLGGSVLFGQLGWDNGTTFSLKLGNSQINGGADAQSVTKSLPYTGLYEINVTEVANRYGSGTVTLNISWPGGAWSSGPTSGWSPGPSFYTTAQVSSVGSMNFSYSGSGEVWIGIQVNYPLGTALIGSLLLVSDDPLNANRALADHTTVDGDISTISYDNETTQSSGVSVTSSDGSLSQNIGGWPLSSLTVLYTPITPGQNSISVTPWQPGRVSSSTITSNEISVLDNPSNVVVAVSNILPSANMVQGYPVYDMSSDNTAYDADNFGEMHFDADNFYPDSQLIARIYATSLPSSAIDYELQSYGFANGELGGDVTPLSIVDLCVDLSNVLLLNARNTVEFRMASPGNAGTTGSDPSQWGVSDPIATIRDILISSNIPRASITYSEWQELQFTPAELADPLISGPDIDIENDGYTNVHEFLMLGNPFIDDVDLVIPGVQTNPISLQMTYIRSKAAGGIQILPQFSDNPNGPFVTAYEQVSVIDMGDHELVTLKDKVEGADYRFGRIQVVESADPFIVPTASDIADTILIGSNSLTTTFTVMNVGNDFAQYTVQASDSALFTPQTITLAPGQVATVTIPLNGGSLTPGNITGTIDLLLGKSTTLMQTVSYNLTIPTDGDNGGLGDGLPDQWEWENFGTLEHGPNDDPDNDDLTTSIEMALGTHPNDNDTDNDLLPDGFEVNSPFLDPLVPDDPESDGDGDGLDLLEEYMNNTNPDEPDTDFDGTWDGTEVTQGSFPNDPSDNGGPPPPDLAAEIICQVGDPSGSHSERWEMIITRNSDGAEIRKVVAYTHGEMSEETSIKQVRRGESYSIVVKHISSKAFMPDYDWRAIVKNGASYPDSPVVIIDPGNLLNNPDLPEQTDYHAGNETNTADGLTAEVAIPIVHVNPAVSPIELLNDNVIFADVQPVSAAPESVRTIFEMRRQGTGFWYIIQDAATLQYSDTARVAGYWEIRATTTFQSKFETVDVVGEINNLEIQFPPVSSMLGDVTLRLDMSISWDNSIDFSTPSSYREYGAWVKVDTSFETFDFVDPRVEGTPGSPGTVVSLQLPPFPGDSIANPTPLQKPVYIVGFFHTHPPYTYAPTGTQRPVGPSGQDIISANEAGIPGIVRDYVGDGFWLQAGHSEYASWQDTPFGPIRRPTP